jgi:uncharacterized protein (DUF362 family)
MNRRDFLVGTAALSAFTAFGKYGRVLGNITSPGYDLVAVKGSSPATMLEHGLNAMGGIRAFVKKNQTVVIKPNIGWDTAPDHAADTNPELVGRLVKLCKEAGAKDVYVFDHTCDTWNKCYKNSGIERAVKDNGGKIAPGNSESNYHEVEIKNGKRLKTAKVHELILDSAVFINLPILKNHGSTRLSIGMKNMMGVVWDRGYWHKNDLHQCIADFGTFRKPDLTIVDAYAVMKQNGPRGVSLDDVTVMKSLLVSRDVVAADAAAAKLFGMEPEDISYINISDAMKIGRKDIKNLKVQRISL